MIDGLNGFAEFADELNNYSSAELAASDSWHDFLYIPAALDPGNQYMDFCELLGYIVAEVDTWKVELVGIRDLLPDSDISYTAGAVVIDNPFSKIDAVRKTDFTTAIANAQDFLTNVAAGLGITSISLANGVISYDCPSGAATYSIGGSGISIPSADKPYIRPATPSPFRPDIALHSISLVIERKPQFICYGHYGILDDAVTMLRMGEEQIQLWLAIIKDRKTNGLNLNEDDIFEEILDKDNHVSIFHQLKPDIQEREVYFTKNSIRGMVEFINR